MPHSFRAQLWKLSTDHEQETTVTFKVPKADYEKVSPVGQLAEQVLFVTVFREQEVGAQA
jgi:hypothetical protein